jgi:MFS family permease
MAAPLILLTLRLVQGFAVGGEWAGAALLSAEYAPAQARGRYGMYTQMGVGSGLVMSSLLFLVVNQTIGESSRAFIEWGWRIPFLFSAVLIVIALYVRLNVAESPVFVEQKARGVSRVTPLADLFRSQRREVVLAAGSMIGFFTLGYMANAYLTSYAHTHVGFSPMLVLAVGVLGGVVVIVFNTLGCLLSDIVGRRRVIIAAFAVGVPWSFVVLPLVDTGNAALFALALAGTYAVAGMAYGPMAAFIPEMFGTRYRYSGAAVSLNLAGLVGGAVPTIIAAPVLATCGVPAIGAMMAAVVFVSVVCTALLPETKGTVLQSE